MFDTVLIYQFNYTIPLYIKWPIRKVVQWIVRISLVHIYVRQEVLKSDWLLLQENI